MGETNKTILIICEGEKTEPLFFNAIRDKLLDNEYNNEIRNIKVTIAPEPLVESDIKQDFKIKHKSKRKKRKTKKVNGIIPIEDGQPPLRWVKTAQRELMTGAYSEVWAVFDNDNHPAREEALQEAEKDINGKIVNIAYSSLSFEYYLLIHFERIYRQFTETDCKQKGKFMRCGTNLYPDKDCDGSICINGYAQKNNFWNNSNDENTKQTINTFSLIENKLEVGFENASWIRFKSDCLQNKVPISDRNPYLSTDKIVKRLIGNDYVYIWININVKYEFKEIGISVKIEDNLIKIINLSNQTIILPENSISTLTNKERYQFGNKQVVFVNKEVVIDFSGYIIDNNMFQIKYKTFKIMFENKA